MLRNFIVALVLAVAMAGAGLIASAHAAEGQQPSSGDVRSDETPSDLLTLAKGAVLVSASVDPTKALALTDGDATSNWSTSTKRNPLPYTFVFELLAPTNITQVGISGAGQRPGGVAGGSARTVLIEGSAEGPDSGFVALTKIEATPEGTTLAEVLPGAPLRWLRFTVTAAQAETAWVYFTEVVAHGTQTLPEAEDRFTGIFQSGRRNLIELKQDGASLSGCYLDNGGSSSGEISGAVSDGVARVNWTSSQGITGSALLTIDSQGALAGVRYRDKSRRAWGGPPAPEDATTQCSEAPPTNPIAAALASTGEARIYGILFDHDSAIPTASSAAALRQLFEALESGETFDVNIEGHTDSDGDDAYNLSLSEQRALSVVQWLIDAGIASTRLRPFGKGETEPVASNNTADGKALNRRVDVVIR